MDEPCKQDMRSDCAMRFGRGEQRMGDFERRCEQKEERIDELRRWQNRAIGYTLAISTLISAGFAWFLKK